jgi:hypothetical protein
MAIQYSGTVNNAMLDTIESTIGTSAVLEVRSGTVEASAGATASGTLLVTMQLPSDWLAAASGGSKAKSGAWSGTGVAAANAGHFRIYEKTNATAHIQGTVTATGGGGDLTLDNVSIATAQTVTISTFQINRAAANQ